MPSIGYKLSALDNDGTFYILADACLRIRSVDQAACPTCSALPTKVSRLAEMAQHPKPHTNYRYLNHEQLVDRVKESAGQVKDLRLEVRTMY